MRIEIMRDAALVKMQATLDADDKREFGKASLDRTTLALEIDGSLMVRDTHNDLLALAAIVAFSPWIGKRLKFNLPVSRPFANAAAHSLHISVEDVSNKIEPRTPKSDSRPSLSFSAGVDSIACLAIMPEETVAVFSHRSTPKEPRTTAYNPDSPLHAISQLRGLGREVHSVRSNLEWLRNPVGFGVDPGPAVPLILLADWFNLNSIGFGTIAEAAYRTGTEHYIDYAERPVFTKWSSIFEAAGLMYFNCVAPMSEICTTKIANTHEYGRFAQSCVRGKRAEPCRRCVKCFRKSLIEASVTGAWPSRDEVKAMMATRPIRTYLEGAPIRLEIVLMSALSTYDGSDPLLQSLRDRVGAKLVDTSFTEGWYEPGMEAMVPLRYQDSVKASLSTYVPKMSRAQERAFEAWDIRPHIQERIESGSVDRFREILKNNAIEAKMQGLV